jgi:DNA-directed RNA polymerase subunit RPC12/RpoP
MHVAGPRTRKTISVDESFEFAKTVPTSNLQIAGDRSQSRAHKQISMWEPKTMDEPAVEVSCKNCGKTFSAFLKEMADKNAEVTCPSCGENTGNGQPNDETRPTTGR